MVVNLPYTCMPMAIHPVYLPCCTKTNHFCTKSNPSKWCLYLVLKTPNITVKLNMRIIPFTFLDYTSLSGSAQFAVDHKQLSGKLLELKYGFIITT